MFHSLISTENWRRFVIYGIQATISTYLLMPKNVTTVTVIELKNVAYSLFVKVANIFIS